MRKSQLESFETGDSNDYKNPIWPYYHLLHGNYFSYVRVLRHKKYFLICIRVMLDEGGNGQQMLTFDKFNQIAYRTLIAYKIDPNGPRRTSGGHPIAELLDVNQESEYDRVIPKQ